MKRTLLLPIILVLFNLSTFAQVENYSVVAPNSIHTANELETKIGWWSEARFGMFIHWGLYSIPAGIWNGEPIQHKNYVNPFCEHIQWINRIPIAEYEPLATQFNPTGFNADRIVATAKAAGMKYIVFTAKHHDGFAMYNSKTDLFNIVEASPYHKDPLEMLAKACKKEGIKLGIYYSLGRDWHNPDASLTSWGNTWDFPVDSTRNYLKYLDEKVKPQLKELLTNYGEVAIIWFDTPEKTTKEESQDLYNLVVSLQPNCIVNTRLGNNIGDYKEMGDNFIPQKKDAAYWETPGTMAASWGFSNIDSNEYWKSTKTLIRQLIDIVSKGGNYLLNIGPDGMGNIPSPTLGRLSSISTWMKVNGEAIYGTKSSRFGQPYWGRYTEKGNVVYAHLFEQPDNNTIIITINIEEIDKIELLSSKGNQPIQFKSTFGKGILISIPKNTVKNLPSVVKITLKS